MDQLLPNRHLFENSLLRTLLEDDDVPFGLTLVNPEGHLVFVNHVAAVHYNLHIEIVPGHIHFQEIFPAFVELRKVVARCLEGKQEQFSFGTVKIKDQFLSIKGSATKVGLLIISVDITRSRVREMDMLSALLEGQEMERQRLARDLHDGVGPLISTVNINLEALKIEWKEASPAVHRRLETIENLVKNIAGDVRAISHALIPSTLTDLGLVAALENLCNSAHEAGPTNVVFYSTGLSQALDRQLSLSLFRIAQELLNNALKYAQAQNINCQLIEHPDSIMLQIEDDGIGVDKFQLKKMMNKGIGLNNVIMRTRSLNGRYTIESQSHRGFFVSVEIPLNFNQ